MPAPDDVADERVPVRSRRRHVRWLSIVGVVACCFGVPRLIGPAQTPAQRHLSDIDVRGYERVDDYIDPGTAPDEARAAVAIFVGPPDDDVLARVSGPGLVLSTPPNDQVFPGLDMVGRGRWHGCFVHVNRWQASDPPSASDKLTAEQAAAFRAGRLSVLDIAVGCGDG